jgi:hypothetical protein
MAFHPDELRGPHGEWIAMGAAALKPGSAAHAEFLAHPGKDKIAEHLGRAAGAIKAGDNASAKTHLTNALAAAGGKDAANLRATISSRRSKLPATGHVAELAAQLKPVPAKIAPPPLPADPSGGSSLKDAIASGVKAETASKASHVVKRTEYNNGQVWYSKNSDKTTSDAEVLAGEVSRVLGTGAPAVVVKGSRIHTAEIKGKTGSEALGLDDFSIAPADRNARAEPFSSSERGKRIGLLDAITGNTDRTDKNWMIDTSGEPVPIDHSHARYEHKPLQSTGRFTKALAGSGASWSAGQKAEWRAGLNALAPQYAALGRADWHKSLMAEFDKQTG